MIPKHSLKHAHDMIFFIKSGKNPQKLRNKVGKFLAERNLNVKKAKTNLVKPNQCFDFLGWHFKIRAKNNKFISYRSNDSRLKMIVKIKRHA